MACKDLLWRIKIKIKICWLYNLVKVPNKNIKKITLMGKDPFNWISAFTQVAVARLALIKNK